MRRRSTRRPTAAAASALSPTLSVGVSDPDANPLTVTFFGRPFASGNFAQIAQNTGVASGTNTTTPWASLGAGQEFEWYATVSDGTLTTTGPTWTFHTTASTDPVFVGAGDIADCARTQDTATGNVIGWDRRQRLHRRRQRLPERHGCRLHELLRADAWGGASRLATRPVPGNHDWGTGVTTSTATSATSARLRPTERQELLQLRHPEQQLAHRQPRQRMRQRAGWLHGRLRRRSCGSRPTSRPTAPRTSSPCGTSRATARRATNLTDLQPLWDDLYEAGVDILLDGHDHIYERLAPMKSAPPAARRRRPDVRHSAVHGRDGRGGAPRLRHHAGAQPGAQQHDLRRLQVHPPRDHVRLGLPADRRADVHGLGQRARCTQRRRTRRPSPRPTATTRPRTPPSTSSAPGVLGNDTDADGDPLTAVLNTTVGHGTLTLNANGSFLYTPTNGYSGPDSFTYHANDGTRELERRDGLTDGWYLRQHRPPAQWLEPVRDRRHGQSAAQRDVHRRAVVQADRRRGRHEHRHRRDRQRDPAHHQGPGRRRDTGPGHQLLLRHRRHERQARRRLRGRRGRDLAEPQPPGQRHRVIAADSVWHHAAATYDGTTWNLYLDGALDGTLSVGRPANAATNVLTVRRQRRSTPPAPPPASSPARSTRSGSGASRAA